VSDIGAKVIWMQLAIVHEESATMVRAAGLEVGMDRCINIGHARLFGDWKTADVKSGVIQAWRTGTLKRQKTQAPERETSARLWTETH
jgi:hypothetical protein